MRSLHVTVLLGIALVCATAIVIALVLKDDTEPAGTPTRDEMCAAFPQSC